MTVKEVDIYEFCKPRLFKEFEKKYPSRTQIEEHGIFKRTYQRKGKQKRQRTERLKKNPKKVTLCRVKELEIYVFPYEYPDTVFIGKYPTFSMALDRYDIPRLFVLVNKMRWFLDGKWQKRVNFTKEAQTHSALLQKAYNLGLDELKKKSPSFLK